MLWLQIFAFIALAGCYRAWGIEDEDQQLKLINFDKYLNSFPYPYVKNNTFTSAVVSYSSGPLCSGLHVSQVWVISAASCVYRHPARDLFVITRRTNYTHMGQDSHEYLPVKNVFINPSYNFTTGYHNIVLMKLMRPLKEVPVLRLPSLGSSGTQELPQVYISKYSYSNDNKVFSPQMSGVEAKVNLNECLENYLNVPINLYFCVSLTEGTSYSYGLLDLGTGMTYLQNGQMFLLGLFTATEYSSFNNFRTHYLYENILPSIEFLHSHLKHDTQYEEDGSYSY